MISPVLFPFTYERLASCGDDLDEMLHVFATSIPDTIPLDLLSKVTSTVSGIDLPAHLKWQPRPDQPERHDQQEGFYNSSTTGVCWLLGGNGAGCLGAEQEVFDPVLNKYRKVSEIDGAFHVWALNKVGQRVIAKASKPRVYGKSDLFQVSLSGGKKIVVTLGHRVLDRDSEWTQIGDIQGVAHGELWGGKIIFPDPVFLRHDEYWDFSVEEHENYWMAGAWHHNTTETTMAKVAKFVLNHPAPRPDTPFWVIGGSYEQSMETCWKEKLYGHGHILDSDVDWDRVQWYRPKMQLPFRVPLFPGHNQKFAENPDANWCLEFKSWRQGADQMMARSIGGFAFVEQFPWGVFTEVLRGCREYSFPGSKLVEYTPVDPDLSGDIEEMIANGRRPEDMSSHRPGMKYLPDNWEVFHANTECAMEAGHVTKEWFLEYFGMIPKESLGMRLKGLFASYEGVIYKTFDPSIHVVGDEIYDWIIAGAASHRRAIDWGAGPQNAFVCLWGARNRQNQWFVYDELYSTDQEKTVVDHLVDITRRHPWPNEPWYGTTYADPSSPGNIRLAQQLAKYGPQDKIVPNLNMSMARNSVIEGIEHVQWLLKRSIPEWNEFTETMVQRPRLFIHYSCVNLIREMKKYRWVRGTGADGRTENPTNPRPEPLKFDDHACDALRYLTFSDDSTLGLTIDSMRSSSKAAQHVAKSQNGSWRDVFSGNGDETSFGDRYGRGSRKSQREQAMAIKLVGGGS